MLFVTRSTKTGAECEITLSLRASAHTGVAIRSPAMRSIALAIGQQFYTYKLQFILAVSLPGRENGKRLPAQAMPGKLHFISPIKNRAIRGPCFVSYFLLTTPSPHGIISRINTAARRALVLPLFRQGIFLGERRPL